MSFTKVAPAGIGTEPGTSILIGDSLLHSTGIDLGHNTGIGVTIRKHGDATFTGIVTAASFSGSGANLTGIDATAIKHTDGNVKVQAINTGANLTGNLSVSGNLGVGGVLTYEDVTNVDSIGIITARSGIQIGAGGTIGSSGGGIVTYFGDGGQLTNITSVGGATGVDFNDNVKVRLGTGNDFEIFHDGTYNYLKGINNQATLFFTNNTQRIVLQEDGHLRPSANNTYDLGTTSDRWRNIYSADLQLSNKDSKNDVDGTWGDYTIQEGENDLFLINNRNGKKYKFNLTEVS